jgi:hypothetical protein
MILWACVALIINLVSTNWWKISTSGERSAFLVFVPSNRLTTSKSIIKFRVGRYDVLLYRVGITICTWLIHSLHDIRAIATFDYILPLMPELFRFTEG